MRGTAEKGHVIKTAKSQGKMSNALLEAIQLPSVIREEAPGTKGRPESKTSSSLKRSPFFDTSASAESLSRDTSAV